MHNQPRHTDGFSPLRSKKATGALSVMQYVRLDVRT